MQNKLQELTEKIYREGLEKGQAEANQLVAKAKEEAARILADAKAEAERIVAASRKEADDYRKNIDTEVTLSAKQVISGLKKQIVSLIETKLFEASLVDALKDAEFMKKVIETAINRWDPNSAESVSLRILVPTEMAEAITKHFTSKTLALLNKEVEVQVDKGIKYGFRIGPKDGSYVVSFTEADFENLFKDFMRPKIVAMLFGGK